MYSLLLLSLLLFKDGRTPLHLASLNDFIELAEMLIDRGAHLNDTDEVFVVNIIIIITIIIM